VGCESQGSPSPCYSSVNLGPMVQQQLGYLQVPQLARDSEGLPLFDRGIAISPLSNNRAASSTLPPQLLSEAFSQAYYCSSYLDVAPLLREAASTSVLAD